MWTLHDSASTRPAAPEHRILPTSPELHPWGRHISHSDLSYASDQRTTKARYALSHSPLAARRARIRWLRTIGALLPREATRARRDAARRDVLRPPRRRRLRRSPPLVGVRRGL